MQELLLNKSPCHLFSSYSFTRILKLKYQKFCLEKQGCQGMVKVGKRQKKRERLWGQLSCSCWGKLQKAWELEILLSSIVELQKELAPFSASDDIFLESDQYSYFKLQNMQILGAQASVGHRLQCSCLSWKQRGLFSFLTICCRYSFDSFPHWWGR